MRLSILISSCASCSLLAVFLVSLFGGMNWLIRGASVEAVKPQVPSPLYIGMGISYRIDPAAQLNIDCDIDPNEPRNLICCLTESPNGGCNDIPRTFKCDGIWERNLVPSIDTKFFCQTPPP